MSIEGWHGQRWQHSRTREAGAGGTTDTCLGGWSKNQRLKKHYGRWMDIVRSLELESFILAKLTKPSVPVILVGPQPPTMVGPS